MRFKYLDIPIIALSALCLLTPSLTAAEEDFPTVIRPFLKQYCLGCHGSKSNKGNEDSTK